MATRINIIIVTKNCEHTIGHTLLSISIQINRDFRIIIVDGKSSDNTVNVASSYLGDGDILISEPDEGIYDAMNKGIGYVTNSDEYILFLNSGDLLIGSKSMDQAKDAIDMHKGKLIFLPWMEGAVKLLPNANAKFSLPGCHQAILYPSMAFCDLRFSKAYKLSSDYLHYLECLENGIQPAFIIDQEAFSRYDLTGISSRNVNQLIVEQFAINKLRHGIAPAGLWFIWRKVKNAWNSLQHNHTAI